MSCPACKAGTSDRSKADVFVIGAAFAKASWPLVRRALCEEHGRYFDRLLRAALDELAEALRRRSAAKETR